MFSFVILWLHALGDSVQEQQQKWNDKKQKVEDFVKQYEHAQSFTAADVEKVDTLATAIVALLMVAEDPLKKEINDCLNELIKIRKRCYSILGYRVIIPAYPPFQSLGLPVDPGFLQTDRGSSETSNATAGRQGEKSCFSFAQLCAAGGNEGLDQHLNKDHTGKLHHSILLIDSAAVCSD